ncbi:MAG: FMN-binding protein [Planctomycetaceae bacterium]
MKRVRMDRWMVFLLCVIMSVTGVNGEDVAVLKTGSRVTGKVLSYDSSSVSIEAKVGSRTVTRKYPATQIKSLTVDGVDVDLTKIPAGESGSIKRADRSQTEILAEIERVGSTRPDWLESTPLDYPKSLDLSWPEKAEGPWDSSKNVGQYIWDRINPNPGKWREGVRLIHYILSTTKDKALQQRAMLTLGGMYHNLHQDYARSAYWYQQAGIDKNAGNRPQAGLHLANCYWQLGSKPMALAMLKSMSSKPYGAIKLLGDLGETRDALEMAERFSKTGEACVCFLYAGDACRVAGRLKEAEDYYRKAITAIKPDEAEKPHRKRDKARAESSLTAIEFYTLDPKQAKDGTYTSSSIGYEAEVKVEVVVKNGRIEDVRVVQHREKQFYSSIADTPKKILSRQSFKDVDATTGATITSEAIINATAKALASGR